jgi:hypothetical protein
MNHTDQTSMNSWLIAFFFLRLNYIYIETKMQFTCHENYDDDKCIYVLNRKDETRSTYIHFLFLMSTVDMRIKMTDI